MSSEFYGRARMDRQTMMSILTDRGVSIPQTRILTRDELISMLAASDPGNPTSQAMRPQEYRGSVSPIRSQVQRTIETKSPDPRFQTSRSKSPIRSPRKSAPFENIDLPTIKHRQNESTALLSKAMEASFSESRKGGIGYLSLTLGVGMIAVLAIVFIPVLSEQAAKAVFCGKGIGTQDCIPCPDHAVCELGKMTCIKPYIREGNFCIENKQLIQDMYFVLHALEDLVETESARLYTENRAKYQISLKEAIMLLQARNLKVQNWADTLNKLETFLGSGKHQGNLKVENKGHDIIVLSVLNQNLNLFQRYQLGRVEIYVQDELYTIVAYAFLILLSLYYVFSRLRRRREHSKALAAFENIKTQLRSLHDDTLTHGMSEDNIKEALQKNASDLDVLWPLLEALRTADPDVCKFQQLMGGRPATYWQWKGRVN